MTSRKIVAVFESQPAAENARSGLLDLGLQPNDISIVDQRSSQHTVQTPAARGTFWAHVKEMFMPEEDRSTLEEGIRRGGYLVVATVDDARADEAISRLESAGAVDLDEQEGQWRAAGWTGAAPAPDRSGQSDVAAPAASANATIPEPARAAADREAEQERIPVIEERLRVGKREVNRGTVRVRSYIVEEPVHEDVRLREERVDIERRPVNEPVRPVAKGAPGDLLQERTIEITETGEQAVIGKEARVTEEVVVSKKAGERVERVDDTLRHTRVEVEDNRNTDSEPRSATPPTEPLRPGRRD
jgi:uncharacterized protein (TIGR02271 family)